MYAIRPWIVRPVLCGRNVQKNNFFSFFILFFFSSSSSRTRDNCAFRHRGGGGGETRELLNLAQRRRTCSVHGYYTGTRMAANRTMPRVPKGLFTFRPEFEQTVYGCVHSNTSSFAGDFRSSRQCAGTRVFRVVESQKAFWFLLARFFQQECMCDGMFFQFLFTKHDRSRPRWKWLRFMFCTTFAYERIGRIKIRNSRATQITRKIP